MISDSFGREVLRKNYALIFLLAFVFYLASNAILRPYGFYIGNKILADIVVCGLFSVLVLLLFSRASRQRKDLQSDKKRANKIFDPANIRNLFDSQLVGLPLLFFFQVLIAALFITYADGRLIFSDDHPSFLYRLQLLREQFPSIPFYNTDWNAGYSAREFFPSGVLNVFFLSAPILYLLEDFNNFSSSYIYTWLIAYLFIGLIPLSVYLSARVFGVDRAVSGLAALFALGPSAGYFEWLLKYGTIGFALSAGFVPLTLAFCARLAVFQEAPRWRDVAMLLIVSFLTLCWTPAVLAVLPVLAIALLTPRKVFSRKRGSKVFAFTCLFLVFNGPWLTTFVLESKVLSFISGDSLPGSKVTSFTKRTSVQHEHMRASAPRTGVNQENTGFFETLLSSHQLKDFSSILHKVNPLLLFLFIPGVFALRSSESRYVLFFSVAFLLIVAAIGDALKPQLELRRMIVPASFLMCIPVACGVGACLKQLSTKSTVVALIGTVILSGALFISPLTVAATYVNRSSERFVFASEQTNQLAAAIAAHGGSGRTFFLGFILQELEASWYAAQDGGHIASLATFSGKPLYASDFYHRRWSTVDPIPKSFRQRGVDGIEEFLDLVHATAVVTFKREWADYCLSSARYEQVFKNGRFRLFTRKSSPDGYFLEGRGKLHYERNSISLSAETETIVLKFRYLPRLRVNLPELVSITPKFVFREEVGAAATEDVFYIKLKFAPEMIAEQKVVRITY